MLINSDVETQREGNKSDETNSTKTTVAQNVSHQQALSPSQLCGRSRLALAQREGQRRGDAPPGGR